MKGIRVFLAAVALVCVVGSVVAAPMMQVKMAETYVKTAEGGGFTAKSAAKEARQRIDALKKTYGADDPDVQALEKRLLVVEGKAQAAQAEKLAQEKAAREKREAALKAKTASVLPAAAAIVHKAPQPWVLAKDYDNRDSDNPVRKYAKNLGKEDKNAVLALDKQLRVRIEEDRRIVAADGPGKEAAQQELDRYEYFLDSIAGPVRYDCDGSINVEKKQLIFNSFQIRLSNFTTKVMRNKKDGKFYFFGENGEPEYIREKEIPYVKEARMCMYYINVFCAEQPKEEYTKLQSLAAVCAMYTDAALKNNSPKAVIFHPMPPKGALHEPLAKEALACSYRTYPNAVDAVIASNDWDIQRNSLGIIIRRVCVGWIIIKDDLGKRAIPAKWAQPHQGGSAYGKLHLFIHGGNKKFYVK